MALSNAERGRRWRAANPEHARVYARRWASTNLVHVRARARVRYAADPTATLDRAKAWVAANPERHRISSRAQGKIRRTTQPELYRASARRRRAHIAQVLATLTAAEWEAILEAAGHACIYCGGRQQITQDHLTPLARGGPHTAENVAPACLPCNLSKGAKDAAEFLEEAV